jgi:hypothetical protein
MVQWAGIQLQPKTDGIAYCQATPLTSQEVDLFSMPTPALDLVPVLYNQAFLAVVQLALSQVVAQNTSYVVAQSDLGDGAWVDLAWCLWTALSGSATFTLTGGSSGDNAFQQSRLPGQAPGFTGSNRCMLGGRLRFVGAATLAASLAASSSAAALQASSSSPTGAPVFPQCQASIHYRVLGLR